MKSTGSRTCHVRHYGHTFPPIHSWVSPRAAAKRWHRFADPQGCPDRYAAGQTLLATETEPGPSGRRQGSFRLERGFLSLALRACMGADIIQAPSIQTLPPSKPAAQARECVGAAGLRIIRARLPAALPRTARGRTPRDRRPFRPARRTSPAARTAPSPARSRRRGPSRRAWPARCRCSRPPP